MDFDGNVVALRRPLGGFGHFETGANQVNAELALSGDIRGETSSLHRREVQHVRLTNLWTFGCAVAISRCGEGYGTAEKSLGKLQICDWEPAKDTQTRKSQDGTEDSCCL